MLLYLANENIYLHAVLFIYGKDNFESVASCLILSWFSAFYYSIRTFLDSPVSFRRERNTTAEPGGIKLTLHAC
jgi:hypothetical protein